MIVFSNSHCAIVTNIKITHMEEWSLINVLAVFHFAKQGQSH